jgi:two-component sensor histidine kinase
VSRPETWLATQIGSTDLSDGDRLLLDRARLGLKLILAGIAIVFVGALILRPRERLLVNVVQAANFVAVAAALRLLHESRGRIFNHVVGLAAYAATVIATGAVGIAARDATTPVVLCVGLAVVSGTLLPWSPWWQLSSVLVVTATAIWTVATVVESPRLFWLQYVGAIAPTLASTVLITYVLQRQRAVVERAEIERRSREKGLREANRQLEREIQEHRKTEETLRFAMRELDHRVKNTLATVQAVADQTLRSARTMSEFGDAFSGRIQAMARIHNALAERRWEGLTMAQLIELVVGPYRHHAESVLIQCDGTFVSSELIRVLGLTLHELATNAAKYGALSTKEGRVRISSRVDPAAASRLRIQWEELDGPAVREPARRGFGIRLIEEALAYEVEGRATLQFPSEGLRCQIDIPVAPAST